MATATKKPVTKKTVKAKPDLELMQKTISNLTDLLSSLERDVARIKIRMGL